MSGVQQRALLTDLVIAGLLAAVVLILTAGLGVVAFIAVPVLLVLLLTLLVERLVGRRRHGHG
jgi:hypothetical protein